MLQLATLTILPVLILAQLQNKFTTHRIGEYEVQYDIKKKVIIFTGQKVCYIVESDYGWYLVMRDNEEFRKVIARIVSQIRSGDGCKRLTQPQAWYTYGGILGEKKCRDKNIFRIDYKSNLIFRQ